MNRDAINALDKTVAVARERCGARIPVVGVAGPQGSGKTTLVMAYAAEHPGVAHFSLDDVYLSADERKERAANIHPLFATRGPPGTHDVDLLHATLTTLEQAKPGSRTPIPAFDKVADDPRPKSGWPIIDGRPSLILVDGWCLGAEPADQEDLVAPVNALERDEDELGEWRKQINSQLRYAYSIAFSRLDAILYLRPPSFDAVFDWRCQQEEGLLGRPLSERDKARIARFIAHFERITRSMMAGARRAEIEVQLDAQRRVTDVVREPPA
ncbi:MAG TPA: hypothetical protein VG942_12080 [Hyphomonadaceae bacterium]|nr:hypothetical protein [Hyphomonadaceae bacterium]